MTVFRFWKTHISGWLLAVVAIGLSIAAACFADDPSTSVKVIKGSAWLTGIAAIWVVFVSQYDAWMEERTARQKADNALSAAADMRGRIVLLLSPNNPLANQLYPASFLKICCDCANHGKVSCEIRKVNVEVNPPDGHWFEIINPLSVPIAVNPERAFVYVDNVLVRGVSPEDLRKSKITVHLIDSLGTRYPNTITTISPELLMETI